MTVTSTPRLRRFFARSARFTSWRSSLRLAASRRCWFDAPRRCWLVGTCTLPGPDEVRDRSFAGKSTGNVGKVRVAARLAGDPRRSPQPSGGSSVLVAGFPTGAFQANCYLLAAGEGEPCGVGGPGHDALAPPARAPPH